MLTATPGSLTNWYGPSWQSWLKDCCIEEKGGAFPQVFNLRDSVIETEGRFLILLCDINNCPYILVDVYAPNSHHLCFMRKLMSKIDKVKYGNLILCGNFNVLANPHIDTTSISLSTIFPHFWPCCTRRNCMTSGTACTTVKETIFSQLGTIHILVYIWSWLTNRSYRGHPQLI